ncbi:MAG: 30S ribosomal protein S27ae [Candidatus Bathyarchaeota archaeon]|nr:30S ribosomal protein S27ae [Candidatus Bathyarchaeota archaeon]
MSKKAAEKKEPAAEEAKPQKPAKAAPAPKAEKKQKDEKGVHTLYKIEGEKVTRLRPTCERCGPGYFMADHHDRYTCGHCGFTRYKKA